MKIEIRNSTLEERDYIEDSIVQYNADKVPFTQSPKFESINFIAKNEQDEILGGVNSILYCWGMLFIDVLWVDQKHRAKGVGSHLMDKLQSIAKEKGCTL